MSIDHFPVRLTDAGAVGIRSLTLVQVPVRGFQQLWRGASVLRIDADASADAQLRLFRSIAHGPLDALRNTICHTRVGVNQNHREFVTAIPRGQIGRAALVRNYVGQSLKRSISRKMGNCDYKPPITELRRTLKASDTPLGRRCRR
jgi:hypothetical protein